jgi:hypothetical protein
MGHRSAEPRSEQPCRHCGEQQHCRLEQELGQRRDERHGMKSQQRREPASRSTDVLGYNTAGVGSVLMGATAAVALRAQETRTSWRQLAAFGAQPERCAPAMLIVSAPRHHREERAAERDGREQVVVLLLAQQHPRAACEGDRRHGG